MLPSMIPAQVFEGWYSKLDQRTDPAEKNNPMMTKKNPKNPYFFSSSGALMAQGEKMAPSATSATKGSLHTRSLPSLHAKQAPESLGLQHSCSCSSLVLQSLTGAAGRLYLALPSCHLLLCKRTTNQENWRVLRHQQRVH